MNFRRSLYTFLACGMSFVLGLYSMGVMYSIKPVDGIQWGITGAFFVAFFFLSISEDPK